MNLIRLLAGTSGFNENALGRMVRYLVLAAAIGALEALANALPGLQLDPSTKLLVLGVALPAIAGAEKALRNRFETPQSVVLPTVTTGTQSPMPVPTPPKMTSTPT